VAAHREPVDLVQLGEDAMVWGPWLLLAVCAVLAAFTH
jgi:hypothetical protein